jgi:hypothetical protein
MSELATLPEDPFARYLASDRPPIMKFNSGHWFVGRDAEEVGPEQKFCVSL